MLVLDGKAKSAVSCAVNHLQGQVEVEFYRILTFSKEGGLGSLDRMAFFGIRKGADQEGGDNMESVKEESIYSLSSG